MLKDRRHGAPDGGQEGRDVARDLSPQVLRVGLEHDPLGTFVDRLAQEEEDDAGLAAAAAANTTTAFDHSNHTAIGWDLPVLNVELTEACLDLLEQALASQSHDGIFPTILPRCRTTNRTTAAASSSSSHGEERSADCWKDWIKSVCRSKQGIANDSTTMEKELLSRLSDSEADFCWIACRELEALR